MDSIPAPFTTATPSACRRAWTGGSPFPPEWRLYTGTKSLDRAGFHALVRAAGLPEAELRHMGFRPADLSPTSFDVWVERAEELLGRIAWDAAVGARGGVWLGDDIQRLHAHMLGVQIVRGWFA